MPFCKTSQTMFSQMLKLLQGRSRMCTKPWTKRWNYSIFSGWELGILKLIQKIHCFAVAVPANNDVSNVVDNTAELETGRFTRIMLVLEELTVRNKIPGISYHEHVTNVRVTAKKVGAVFIVRIKINLPLNSRKSCWNHSRIHASEEDSFWLGIVSDFLELSNHLSSCRVPVSHDAS